MELKKFPYYYHGAFMFIISLQSFQAAVLIGVVINSVSSLSNSFGVYFSLIIYPIILNVSFSYLRKVLLEYSQLSLRDLLNADQVMIKLYACYLTLEKGSNITVTGKEKNFYELLFLASISRHTKNCTNTTCSCSMIRIDPSGSDIANEFLANYEIMTRVSSTIIREVFVEAIKIFPQDRSLILYKLSSEITATEDHKCETILNLIDCMKNCKILDQKLSAYKLFQGLEEKTASVEDSRGETLDVRRIYNYYTLKESFTLKLKKNVSRYLEFWRIFTSFNPPISDLLKQSEEIDKHSNELDKLWKQLLSQLSSTSTNEAVVYSLYLHYIRGAPSSSSKLLEYHNKRLHQLHGNAHNRAGVMRNILNHDDLMTIFVNYDENGHESIISSFGNVGLLGYPLREMIGKGMEIFIADCYKTEKDFSLIKHIEEKEGSIIHKFFPFFFKTHSGSNIFANAFISPCLFNQEKLSYILVLTPLRDFETLLLKEDGTIVGHSEKVGRNLKVSENNNIHEICDKASKVLGAARRSKQDLMNSSKRDISFRASKSSWTSKQMLESESVKDSFSNPVKFKVEKNNYYYDIYVHKINIRDIIVLNLKKVHKATDESEFSLLLQNVDEFSQSNVKKTVRTDYLGYSSPSIKDDAKINNELTYTQLVTLKNSNKQAQTISSTKVSAGATVIKIESAINYVHKNHMLEGLHYGVIFLTLLSVALIFTFLMYALGKIETLTETGKMSLVLFSRHFDLWVWGYWLSADLDMILADILDVRFGRDPENFYFSQVLAYPGFVDTYIAESREIERFIPFFDDSLQKEFYQDIRVYDALSNEYKSMSIFKYDDLYADAALRLYDYSFLPFRYLKRSNPYLRFVTDTVFDDQLIMQEKMFDLIVKDTRMKIESIQNLAYLILGIISSGSFILLVIKMSLGLNLVKETEKLIEALRKISDDEIDKEIEVVEEFNRTLMKSHSLEDNYSSLVDKKKHTVNRIHIKKQSDKEKKFKFKTINRGNLNGKSALFIMSFFFYLSILIIIFGISIKLCEDLNQKIDRNMLRMVDLNLIFIKFGVLFLPLYKYIMYGDTFTIRNQPFNSEFEKDYNIAASSSQYFNSFKSDCDEDLKPRVEYILNGDICKLSSSGCRMAQSVSEHGLLMMNSFMNFACRDIKLSYEQSNKTTAALKEIMYRDNYQIMEYIYWLSAPPAFKELQEVSKIQMDRAISSYQTNFKLIIALLIVGFILFFFIMWIPIKRYYIASMASVYKMIRIIPLNILTGNTYIKTYIFKRSNTSMSTVQF